MKKITEWWDRCKERHLCHSRTLILEAGLSTGSVSFPVRLLNCSLAASWPRSPIQLRSRSILETLHPLFGVRMSLFTPVDTCQSTAGGQGPQGCSRVQRWAPCLELHSPSPAGRACCNGLQSYLEVAQSCSLVLSPGMRVSPWRAQAGQLASSSW